MFHELLSFWRDDSGLKHIFRHFDEMLVLAAKMFDAVVRGMFDGTDFSAIGRDVKMMDGQVNILQQVIRRDVIAHLTVHGNADIVPCLAMISIVKDAERLGDYVKNVYEIAEKCFSLRDDPLMPELKQISGKISSWFVSTKKAFDEVDAELARKVREEAYVVEKRCDKIVWDLMNEEGGRNRIAIALAFRFYKRIVAHLANICTSIIMPLDKIDYYKPLSG